MEQELQPLLEHIKLLQERLRKNRSSYILKKKYKAAVRELSFRHQSKLEDTLHEIYDEYFEDDSVQSVLNYLSKDGVLVHGEDFPGVKGTLHMFTNPMRLEFVSQNKEFRTCLWNVA